MAEGWWHRTDDGIALTVRVTPGARRSEVLAVEADRLRIRLAAPPVDGKANEELRRFLAGACGVRRAAVTVVRGERSREKVVAIVGLDAPPPSLAD